MGKRMARKRKRRRASEIANIQPRTGLTKVLLIGIGLAVIIIFKVVMSDDTAEVFKAVTGDPELVLPESILERSDTLPSMPLKDAGTQPAP